MLSQIIAITALNLKSIPGRWHASLVIVIGLAGVVAVFTALLAMADGFSDTLKASGRNDVAMIVRGGSSDSELNSVLGLDAGALISQLPGIRPGTDGKPLAALEMVVIADLMKKGETVNSSNITVRGVDGNSFKLRPNLKIEGRKFNPGLHELIVGRGVSRQFNDIEVGKTLKMRGSEWTVVGVFESGDAYESELWTDIGIAQTAFGRTGYSSVLAELDGEGAMDKIISAAKADPRLNVDVKTQQAYFSDQTKQFRTMIGTLATVVVVIMALGAIFAALNTMYAAVAARSREIATLRAIGFGPALILVSVMIEAIFLSVIGGLIGAAVVYILFNNVALSTLGQNFTQVVFSFKVTPGLVVKGLAIAVIIGLIGGFLPSIRAARLPVTTALRES